LLQHIPEGFYHDKKPVGVAIATDIDDGKPGAYDLPSPSTAGALALPSTEKGIDGKAGAVKGDERDPRWERTGWAPRFGNGDPKDDEGPSMLDYQTWIGGKLEDKFYGGKSHLYDGSFPSLTV
jgi:hypothetical protein